MKRDMDLVRAILQHLKENPEPENFDPLHFDGHSDEEVGYHVKLLYQAGLIEAKESPFSDFEYIPVSLTWNGHEFLETARDEGRWSKAKALMLERSGGLSFDVLKALLTELAKQSVGL